MLQHNHDGHVPTTGGAGPRGRPPPSSGERRPHPVHRVHRLGAVLLGAGLIVFGGLGLASRPEFFSRGEQVMGMGSNGALAVISLIVGTVLLAAAARGGRLASTTTLTVGTLFLLSGFTHLAILDTAANLLGFGLANVFFSFAAGILLLGLGAYGRVSGGLPPDNPYARFNRPRIVAPDQLGADGRGDELTRAEQAAFSGRANAQQQALLRKTATRRADEDHDRAWRRFAAGHTAAETDRMRLVAAAESALSHGPDRRRENPR